MRQLLLLVVLLSLPKILPAQANNEFYNNGTIVYVAAGAEVHVLGDVHMRGASGILHNYGLIKLDGNMYGDNLFQQRGTGTTRFQNNLVNIGLTQKISGSYGVRSTSQAAIGVDDGSFYNLQLANGVGVVWLETNAIAGFTPYVADVRNSVDFLYPASVNNRIITHNPAAIPANGSAYSAVFGLMNPVPGLANLIDNTVTLNGNMSSLDYGYIQGKFRRAIAPAGGTYGYVLGLEPAGAGMQRGMQYMHMNFGANNYDVLQGYFQTALDNTFPTQMECSGYMIDYWGGVDHGQWIIDSPNGGAGTYSMTVWCQDDNFPVKSVWMITKDNSVMGTPDECGPSPVGLTRSGFNGFSQFGVAASDVNILPLELIKIWAVSKEDHIEVNWEVASEQNLSHYELERSEDANTFSYLTSLGASGNSNVQLFYSYDDYAVLREKDYYYRYKAVDFNGDYYYSPIVSGRLNGDLSGTLENAVTLFPNPVEDHVFVGVNSDYARTITIDVINNLGQYVYRENFYIEKGNNVIQLESKHWAQGMYSLGVSDSETNECVWKKMIKK